jgi:cell wall-associated NlpC family hydrolase
MISASMLAACGAPAPRQALPAGAGAPVLPLAKQIVRSAWAYLPEEDAGRSEPKDAADFVRKVYEENGVQLPDSISALSLAGVRAPAGELRAADLLFFSGERISRIAEHVGLYAEKGSFLHYRPGFGVTLERLDAAAYKARFVTARRLIF